MGRRNFNCVICIQLATLLLCSGSNASVRGIPAAENKQLLHHSEAKIEASASNSTSQKDITTPITTMPTTIPTTPTTTGPVFNPTVSNPDLATNGPGNTIMTPITTPFPVSASASWCISSQSASQIALQVALDYACGYGGADCSAIQPGGSCYEPITLHGHASYAFNSYYQKNPIPNSCNFGGTAISTSTDPSYGTCHYQGTSTSATILNTTNSYGATVFGAGPVTPSTSSAASQSAISHFYAFICYILLLRRDHE